MASKTSKDSRSRVSRGFAPVVGFLVGLFVVSLFDMDFSVWSENWWQILIAALALFVVGYFLLSKWW